MVEKVISMEIAVTYWHTLGRISQSVLAVLAALMIYWFFRAVILSRMEKAVAATSNDLDDRMVQFIKQFLWLIGLFTTLAIVLKINSIKISPLLAGAGIFGVSIGFAAKETIADILSGVFLIITGNGKGKTTSAMGMALRSWNRLRHFPDGTV